MMQKEHAIIAQIRAVAADRPEAIALVGAHCTLTYQQLVEQVDACAAYFESLPAVSIAMDLDNGPEWMVIDLALLLAGKVAVPVPAFFSEQQVNHLIHDGGVELLLTQSPLRYASMEPRIAELFELCGVAVHPLHLQQQPVEMPEDTVKVTYTSGTTGEPKGVCIHGAAMAKVVASIAQEAAVTAADRHLSVLPLTTLLENVGGAYVALVRGAMVTLLPQSALGIRGASGIDAAAFMHPFVEHGATTTILIPQMVQLLVGGVEAGLVGGLNLRFAAVGGAPISQQLLERATALELGIHEGYGLSEATSVVAFNRPGENRIGTVGRPLPHVEIKIAEDGELWVKGSLFNGYLGQGEPNLDQEGFLATGDLAALDEAGCLVLKGRKKHLLITAFGRNVAPEWVERELVIEPGILQVALFGDGRPWNVAVVVSRPATDVAAAVEQVNRGLPDYARIRRWIDADAPFSIENGQWTGTARPRREAIWAQYQQRIEALYQSEQEHREIAA